MSMVAPVTSVVAVTPVVAVTATIVTSVTSVVTSVTSVVTSVTSVVTSIVSFVVVGLAVVVSVTDLVATPAVAVATLRIRAMQWQHDRGGDHNSEQPFHRFHRFTPTRLRWRHGPQSMMGRTPRAGEANETDPSAVRRMISMFL